MQHGTGIFHNNDRLLDVVGVFLLDLYADRGLSKKPTSPTICDDGRKIRTRYCVDPSLKRDILTLFLSCKLFFQTGNLTTGHPDKRGNVRWLFRGSSDSPEVSRN